MPIPEQQTSVLSINVENDRKRCSRACDGCKVRRCKCEGYQESPSSEPSCRPCRLNKERCVFTLPVRKRGPPRNNKAQDRSSSDPSPHMGSHESWYTLRQPLPGPSHKSPISSNTTDLNTPSHDQLYGVPSLMVDQLLAVYFTHVHNVWPLIFKPYFNPHKTPSHLLLSMLAVAACVAPSVTQNGLDAQALFIMAERALHRRGMENRVDLIQSLMLLSLRQTGCGDKWSAASYAGRACMMCLTLGLNLVPTSTAVEATANDNDTRARVYWNCYVLDKSIAEETGRPFLLPYRRSSIPFPSIFESDELEAWPPLPASSVAFSSSLHTLVPRRGYVLSCFVWTCRLAMIVEDILDLEIEGPNPGDTKVDWDNRFIRTSRQRRERAVDVDGISRHIDDWKESLPKTLDVDIHKGLSPLPHHAVSIAWYHTAKILLYSRSLRRQHTAAFASPLVSLTPLDASTLSHAVCSDAAQAVVDLLGYLDQYGLLQQASSDVIHILSLATLFEAYDSTSSESELATQAKFNFSRCCSWLRDFSSSWPAASAHKVFFEGLIRGGLKIASVDNDNVDSATHLEETNPSTSRTIRSLPTPSTQSPPMPDGLRAVRRHLSVSEHEPDSSVKSFEPKDSETAPPPNTNLSNLFQLPQYYWSQLINPAEADKMGSLDTYNFTRPSHSGLLPGASPTAMLTRSSGYEMRPNSNEVEFPPNTPGVLGTSMAPALAWSQPTSGLEPVEESLGAVFSDTALSNGGQGQGAIYDALMSYMLEAAKGNT